MTYEEIQQRLTCGSSLTAFELEQLKLIKRETFNNGKQSIRCWFPLKGYWASSTGTYNNTCYAPTGQFRQDSDVENLGWQIDMFDGYWKKLL